MREYRYTVDREGRVFHDGSEIVDGPTLRFFLRVMSIEPDGRHVVLCQGERNWFASDETPFVVQRVALLGATGMVSGIELRFAGDYREPLDPATLESPESPESMGGGLFCRVRGGVFRARFGRVAMQQLAPLLAEDPDGPALVLGGARHPISRIA